MSGPFGDPVDVKADVQSIGELLAGVGPPGPPTPAHKPRKSRGICAICMANGLEVCALECYRCQCGGCGGMEWPPEKWAKNTATGAPKRRHYRCSMVHVAQGAARKAKKWAEEVEQQKQLTAVYNSHTNVVNLYNVHKANADLLIAQQQEKIKILEEAPDDVDDDESQGVELFHDIDGLQQPSSSNQTLFRENQCG